MKLYEYKIFGADNVNLFFDEIKRLCRGIFISRYNSEHIWLHLFKLRGADEEWLYIYIVGNRNKEHIAIYFSDSSDPYSFFHCFSFDFFLGQINKELKNEILFNLDIWKNMSEHIFINEVNKDGHS